MHFVAADWLIALGAINESAACVYSTPLKMVRCSIVVGRAMLKRGVDVRKAGCQKAVGWVTVT